MIENLRNLTKKQLHNLEVILKNEFVTLYERIKLQPDDFNFRYVIFNTFQYGGDRIGNYITLAEALTAFHSETDQQRNLLNRHNSKSSKIYYSVRVVKARSRKEAIDAIIEEDFIETDDLCDSVLSREDLLKELNNRKE